MKKQYVCPEIGFYAVKKHDIVCASDPEYGGDGGGRPAGSAERSHPIWE